MKIFLIGDQPFKAETLEELKANFKPRCRRCSRELETEDGATGNGLAFGLCATCWIVENTWHECCSCERGMVAPGLTICHSCIKLLSGEE